MSVQSTNKCTVLIALLKELAWLIATLALEQNCINECAIYVNRCKYIVIKCAFTQMHEYAKI